MRTIAHISDLHFGRTDPRLVRELGESLRNLNPDLVAISGDLTQRAHTHEFIEARAFLDSLPMPQIIVPGNHDIALYNLYGRFVVRLEQYRRYVTDDLEPFFEDDEVAVLGVNTARALTFKDGRVNRRQLERIRVRMEAVAAGKLRILVAHHPIDLPDSFVQSVIGRARLAASTIAGAGVDVVLSGHLHVTHFSDPTEPLRVGGHTALMFQAGTAVSTRSRGEGNAFNVLRVERERVTVDHLGWSDAVGAFEVCRTDRFAKGAEGWRRTGGDAH